MQYVNKLLFLLIAGLVTTLTACEEETEIAETKEKSRITISSGILPPDLSSMESPSATVAKFGVAVDTSQALDTVYYAVLEAPTKAPDGPTLLKREDVVRFLMSGNVFRSAYQPNLNEERDYVVYALVKEGNYVSEVSHLNLREQPDKTTDPVAGEPDGDSNSDGAPTDEDDGTEGGDSDDGNTDPNDGGGNGDDGGSTDPNDGGDGDGDSSTTPNDGGDDGGTNPGDGNSEPDNGIQPTLANPQLQERGSQQRDLISMAAIVSSDQIDGTIHYLYFKEEDHTGAPTPQELLDNRLTRTVEMGGATIKKFNFVASSNTKYYIYALLKIGDEVSGVVLLEDSTAS